MTNREALNFQLPENLFETQEIERVRQDPNYIGRRNVGIITAYGRKIEIPSHITILGFANIYEGWKAWYRDRTILPNMKGVPKIDITIPYEEQIKEFQDNEWHLNP